MAELHREHLEGAELRLAELASSHADAAVEASHREHLDASEALLAQHAELHHGRLGAAARDAHWEQLGASEARLAELHRSLSSELEEDFKRRLASAPERCGGGLGQQAPERRAPGVGGALKERLRQLAAIEEKMRLPGKRGVPNTTPQREERAPGRAMEFSMATPLGTETPPGSAPFAPAPDAAPQPLATE